MVRAGLINIGSVLTPNKTVDTDPASIAMADMPTTLRSSCLGARRVSYPSCRNVEWVDSPTKVRSNRRTHQACRHGIPC